MKLPVQSVSCCSFGAKDRILLVAPHPDDETLVAGVLLRRAVQAGAAIRVVYATDGDNNPWMQRLLECRWSIGAADRLRYAERRRGEALAALAQIGVPAEQAIFLHYPDQGLTRLLLDRCQPLLAALADQVEQWRPNILIVPSLFDWHPDHSALGVLMRLALERTDAAAQPETVLGYIAHGKRDTPPGMTDIHMIPTHAEQLAKRAALACHATQTAYRKNWFLAMAREPEVFIANDGALAGCEAHPIREVFAGAETLWLDIRQHGRLGARGSTKLLMLTADDGGNLERLEMKLQWRRKRRPLRRLASHEPLGVARLSQRPGGGFVRIPLGLLKPASRVFIKLERRFGFFDEAGWLEIPPPRPFGSVEIEAPGPEAPRAPATCAVIPCYNVAKVCGPVVRAAAEVLDHVIVVDDGSTDGTAAVLREAAEQSGGRITLLSMERNGGKGKALMAGFRQALEQTAAEVIVTLDGDGQHRPEDALALVAACGDGAQFVIGERPVSLAMPLRSKIGNLLTRALLQWFFPGCPADSQSGFRAFDRPFLEAVVQAIEGRRYETELQILLLALEKRVRIDTVTIPTIYMDHNSASHFRPLSDSARIYRTLFEWIWHRDARADAG